MTIDEYVSEVEGRIHALTAICSVLIAYHPEQVAMRKGMDLAAGDRAGGRGRH